MGMIKACLAGFIVSVMMFILVAYIPYDRNSPFPLFCSLPLVGGAVAGGLVEGIRQRKYGSISKKLMVGAGIAGCIGTVFASLFMGVFFTH